jgi:hypothetical protein
VVCDRVVEDFGNSSPGAFPQGWRARDEDDTAYARTSRTFVVEEHGGRNVLHATFRGRTVTIGRPVGDWDIDRYPILEWRWRVVSIPEGADERDPKRNDSAAAVYAIWDVGFPMMVRGLKYAWSSSVPIGTRASKRLGYDHLVVVDSGPSRLGRWQTVRVDVRSDAARAFKKRNLGAPDGIAVFTDADATRSAAEVYYADFKLCRTE